ncbi:MAG: hypothetical protein PsegKO_34690 [Pseudohongiellaceae bacterium]
MNKIFVRVAALVISVAVVAGCQTTGSSSTPSTSGASPVSQLGGNDVVVGTVSGAAIGATIGALIDGRKGAARGALIGGGVGFAAGAIAADRRARFASESEFLDDEINAAELALERQEGRIQNTRRSIAASEREISSLAVRAKRSDQEIAELRATKRELDSQIDRINSDIEGYERAIAYVDAVLSEDLQALELDSAERTKAEEKRRELTRKRNDLQDQYAQVLGVKDLLIEQRSELLTRAPELVDMGRRDG